MTRRNFERDLAIIVSAWQDRYSRAWNASGDSAGGAKHERNPDLLVQWLMSMQGLDVAEGSGIPRLSAELSALEYLELSKGFQYPYGIFTAPSHSPKGLMEECIDWRAGKEIRYGSLPAFVIPRLAWYVVDKESMQHRLNALREPAEPEKEKAEKEKAESDATGRLTPPPATR